MSTVAQVIDRIFRDWLEPPDEQPTRCLLQTGIDAAVTSIVYDPTFLSPEEAGLLGPGTLIEVESEEIICGDVDESSNTISSVKRAANGTTAATHAAGVTIKIAPTWRRRSIFDALCDAVVELYPDLYDVTTQNVTISSSGPTQVNADVAFPLYFYGRVGGANSTVWDRFAPEFLDEFPGVANSKAIVVPGLGESTTGYLVYAKRFTRPAAEADNLTTIGVDPSWERLVVISAAAYLVSGKELDAMTQEFIQAQLEQQGFPAGAASRIRDGLVRYYEFLLTKARRELRTRYPTPIARNW